MLFKKKRKMIDVRELQKRGIVRIPKKDIVVPTNRDGFIEFGANANTTSSNSQQLTANNSSQITDLDNKIYKLEQRIELLEKKLNINKPTESNLGPMGW